MSKSKSAAVRPEIMVKRPLKKRIMDNWQLYAMLLIPVVLTIIYKYIPMYGIQIAFRDYKASKGFSGSEWVGLEWFWRFFSAPTFGRMIKNTVLLSLFSLLWSFPIPIILALMLNQLRFHRFKRLTQTVLYAPHFISTMVICGMIKIFLSPSGGLINLIAGTSIDFLTESAAFRTIYIASESGRMRAGESLSIWQLCRESTRLFTRRPGWTARPCSRESFTSIYRGCAPLWC